MEGVRVTSNFLLYKGQPHGLLSSTLPTRCAPLLGRAADVCLFMHNPIIFFTGTMFAWDTRRPFSGIVAWHPSAATPLAWACA